MTIFRALRFKASTALVLAAFVSSVASPAKAAKFDLTSATIFEIQEAMTAGSLTSERLTELVLARIEAYEEEGPKLNAIITLNPEALAEARLLDKERLEHGPRGLLHGIPILLKDNVETKDLPTTAGFYALRDYQPEQDAEQARRLREAGCIIIGKTNMSEFASGAAISTLGGQIRNPHDPERSPSGSSGGTGAGIAAGFAVFGLGTDTGGSIRGPSAANGIAGLKPTFGLTGRGGIIPLSLSLDTVGPIARNVADLAVALEVMAGPNPRDSATEVLVDRVLDKYTDALDPGALKGARLGVLRDYMGSDPGVDAVIETAIAVMSNHGAKIVDVEFPRFLSGLAGGLYRGIRNPEFPEQITAYLENLPDGLPKSHADVIELTKKITEETPEGWVPNPDRLESYEQELEAGTTEDVPYVRALNEGRKIVRDSLQWYLQDMELDAFIVPTRTRPPSLIEESERPSRPPGSGRGSAAHLANAAGWPDLIVPAGFTSDPALPVAISFIGPAFSEARLLALGYAFEQLMPARRLPVHTPRLDGEKFDY